LLPDSINVPPDGALLSIAENRRAWIQRLAKVPDDQKTLALAAIEAFEVNEAKELLVEEDLAFLVLAACSSHKLVYDTAWCLLGKLAQAHQEAQRCFIRLSGHRSATTRFHAIAYADRSLPESLLTEIFSLALRDRSAKVRSMGIQRVEELGSTPFLEQLAEMQQAETDKGVLEILAFHVPLLRDGYCIRVSTDGKTKQLVMRGTDGSVGGPTLPLECSDEYIRNEVARRRSTKR
jgi:hypothetical protein